MSEVVLKIHPGKQYSTFLLLQSQRKEEEFCDVILQAEEEKFPAHKNVLAAASQYFLKMFTVNMKEKHNKDIMVESVTAKAMGAILNCIYCGHLSISDKSITEILHAASLMQLTNTIEVIASYMQSYLKAENSCLYLKLATLYSFQDVVDKINNFFLTNFQEVADEAGFLQYDADKMDGILCSDDLIVQNEKFVFDFIINWINEDFEERKQEFSRLFRHVRLQYVPVQQIIDDIRHSNLVKANPECRDLVEDALSYYISPTVFATQKRRHCFAPSPDCVMLLPFGKKHQAVYDNEDKTWQNVLYEGLTENTILEDSAIVFHHPITVLCGGKTKSNKASKRVVRFDSVQWMKMPAMNEARCGAAAVFHKGSLYVFQGETFPVSSSAMFFPGQRNPDAENFSKTCEVFDDVCRKWNFFPRSWTISTSYGAAISANDLIYLIGGFMPADDNQENKAYCKFVQCSTCTVHPEKKEAKNIGNLNEARAAFGCAVLNSCIYVVGGYGNNKSMVTSVEVMNTAENIWTRLTRSYGPSNSSFKLGISACIVNDSLFVLDNQGRLCKSVKGENWSPDSLTVSPSGIVISFARWYVNQPFVKIRVN